MNWYLKTILAQEVLSPSTGVMGYLQRLGANEDIIEYITSLDKPTSKFLINEFRKNPTLTLQDLQQNLQSVKLPEKASLYDPSEVLKADQYPIEMQQWILFNFKKLRKGKIIFKTKNEDYERYNFFREKLDEIKDWFNNMHPNISSYSPEQAIEASDQWHLMMAEKGEGLYYEPTKPELILYGPQWKNEKWNGWTVQEVRSENDLLVEGNRMNNCVGDYCEDVQEGNTRIFSLRDTKNYPHVTIETNLTGEKVIQIKGNSNLKPKKEYKDMIKEWILNKPLAPVMDFEDYDDYDNDELLNSGYVEEVIEGLSNIGVGEYGIPVSLFNKDPSSFIDPLIRKKEQENYPSFRDGFWDIPVALVDAAVKSDKLNHNGKWFNLINVEEYLSKLSEETNDMIMNNFDSGWLDIPYPQEEDYETTEEFDKAEEKYQEAEQEVINEAFTETIRGKFSIEGFKYIQELREKGEIPNILVS